MTNFPNLIIVEHHTTGDSGGYCSSCYKVGDKTFPSKEKAFEYILKELGYTVIIED